MISIVHHSVQNGPRPYILLDSDEYGYRHIPIVYLFNLVPHVVNLSLHRRHHHIFTHQVSSIKRPEARQLHSRYGYVSFRNWLQRKIIGRLGDTSCEVERAVGTVYSLTLAPVQHIFTTS